MDDFMLWTWVIGGTPMAMALIQGAVEWSCHAVRTTQDADDSPVGRFPRSDGRGR